MKQFATSFAEDFQAVLQAVGDAADREDSLTLLFTASQFGEGVTTVALSLGLFLSSVYDPTDVLVVEANLRRPSFQTIFGLRAENGLQEALLGRVPIEETIVRAGDPAVYLMPSNRAQQERDLLAVESHGRRFAELIETLREGFRFVIADSPPVVQFMDACRVSPAFDGVIFVVEANGTAAQVADQALEKLRTGGANIMGAVLNKRELHLPDFLYRLL